MLIDLARLGREYLVEGCGYNRLVCPRPSGTGDNYKIFAESFWDEAHLDLFLSDAREIVKNAAHSTELR